MENIKLYGLEKREICGGLTDYSDEQMRALHIVFLLLTGQSTATVLGKK